MVAELKKPQEAAALFAGWEETLIWSCLQGVMGKVYAQKQEQPEAAMAVLGDFCFFGGRPQEALVRYKPAGRGDFIIMVPQHEGWSAMIEKYYGERAKKVTRYAIKKEPDAFDDQMLQRAVEALLPEYGVRLMDETLFHRCRAESWSRDLVSQYASWEEYERLGLGAVILKDGQVVSGASSYSRYRDGIEIEIDTREDHRRRGLAFACGAKLILECRKRGLYPSWDAQNLWSVGLAEKLGYHFDHAYGAYEVWGGGDFHVNL